MSGVWVCMQGSLEFEIANVKIHAYADLYHIAATHFADILRSCRCKTVLFSSK